MVSAFASDYDSVLGERIRDMSGGEGAWKKAWKNGILRI
jgi:hypothetical protein